MENNIEIVIASDEKLVYIGTATSSGCKYPYNSKEDIINAIKEYFDNYVELD